MKVLLISANVCRDPYPVYPLGISVIAGALTEKGHTVEQFDIAPVYKNWREELEKAIHAFQPDMIGVGIRNIDTVNSLNDNEMNLLTLPLETARFCKEKSSVPLVLGGSAFSLLPDFLMENSGADYGVFGEGEEAICRLAESLEKGEKPAEKILHSQSYRQASAIYPKHIVDYYHKETHIIPIQTKRGCPFTCAYCGYPLLEGRDVRMRDCKEVIGDLQSLYERYPDALLYITDAVFNDSGGLFRELLRMMKKQSLKFPFTAFLTPHLLTESDVALLKDCGMIATEVGIDAASDTTLKGLGKNFTFQESVDCCNLLTEYEVSVMTNLMFGGPGETYATIDEGISNVLSMKNVHSMIFSGIRVIPNTPLYDIALKQGVLPENWDGYDEFYYFSPDITSGELDRKLRDAFAGVKYCIYPPQQRRRELQMIHRLGYLKMHAWKSGQTGQS